MGNKDYKMFSPEEFYKYILIETKLAYNKCSLKNEKLYYNVCATKIQKNKPILIGLNWGGNIEQIEPDINKPMVNDESCSNYLVKNSLHSDFEKYYKINLQSFDYNYSNLCFFRSRKANDLTANDWELSKSLIFKLIDYVEPPFIIFFGKTRSEFIYNWELFKNLNIEYIILSHKSNPKISDEFRIKEFKAKSMELTFNFNIG